jgi:hypothetical protein
VAAAARGPLNDPSPTIASATVTRTRSLNSESVSSDAGSESVSRRRPGIRRRVAGGIRRAIRVSVGRLIGRERFSGPNAACGGRSPLGPGPTGARSRGRRAQSRRVTDHRDRDAARARRRRTRTRAGVPSGPPPCRYDHVLIPASGPGTGSGAGPKPGSETGTFKRVTGPGTVTSHGPQASESEDNPGH